MKRFTGVGEHHFPERAESSESIAGYGVGLIGLVCYDSHAGHIDASQFHGGAHEREVAGVNCAEKSEILDRGGVGTGKERLKCAGFANPDAAFLLYFGSILNIDGDFLVGEDIGDAVIVVGSRSDEITVCLDCHHIGGGILRHNPEGVVPSADHLLVRR